VRCPKEEKGRELSRERIVLHPQYRKKICIRGKAKEKNGDVLEGKPSSLLRKRTLTRGKKKEEGINIALSERKTREYPLAKEKRKRYGRSEEKKPVSWVTKAVPCIREREVCISIWALHCKTKEFKPKMKGRFKASLKGALFYKKGG